MSSELDVYILTIIIDNNLSIIGNNYVSRTKENEIIGRKCWIYITLNYIYFFANKFIACLSSIKIIEIQDPIF